MLAAAGMVLAVAGAAGFQREAADFFRSSEMAPQRAFARPDRSPTMAIGLSSVAEGLEPCLIAIDRIAWGKFPEDERRQTAQHCLARADRALRLYPALAAAHQLRAECLSLLGATDAAVESLGYAAATAPNDAWLLQRRVMLALLLPRDERADLQPLVDASVIRLMRTFPTRQWLAELYASAPELGNAIARNEADIAPRDRLSFLHLAQRASKPVVREP
ncbi:MAG: hypothetical protein R3E44_14515 [Paracoccaceae bacterium]